MNNVLSRLLAVFVLSVCFALPTQAQVRLDTLCTQTSPIASLLTSNGLKVSGPTCSRGTALVPTEAEPGILRQGERRTFALPAGLQRINLNSALAIGSPNQTQIQVVVDGVTSEWPFESSLYLDVDGGSQLELSYLSATPIEVKPSLVPVYWTWNGDYNLLVEGESQPVPEIEQLNGPLIVVGRPEQVEVLGLDYTLRPVAWEENAIDVLAEDLAGIVHSEQIQTSLEGAWDATLVEQDGVTLVALDSFVASDGSTKRVIVFSPDVFRLEKKQLDIVFASLNQVLAMGIDGLPGQSTLNPAQATWLNTFMILFRNATLPMMLFALVLLLGLLAPTLLAYFKRPRQLTSYLMPARSIWRRLGQVVLFWSVVLAFIGTSVANAILQNEQSKVVLRVLLDRLKGRAADGGEFCRKCVLIEQTPWLISVIVMVASLSLVWLFWYRLQGLAAYFRQWIKPRLETSKQFSKLRLWLLLSFVLCLFLPMLGIGMAIQFALAGLVLLAFWLLWPVLPPGQLPLRSTWILIGLTLLPGWQLYHSVVGYYAPFETSVQAEFQVSLAGDIRQYMAGSEISLSPDKPLSISADAKAQGGFGRSEFGWVQKGSTPLQLVSKALWSDPNTLWVDPAASRFEGRQAFDGKALLVRNNQPEADSLVSGLEQLAANSQVAVLVESDEVWQQGQPDYFRPEAFLIEQSPGAEQAEAEITHPLGVVGKEQTIAYTWLDTPTTIRLQKHDLNQQIGADEAILTVLNPEGEIVAHQLLEDDGGVLGQVGAIQTFEVALTEEGFVSGVYTLQVESTSQAAAGDYVLDAVTLASPWLVFRGPITIEAGRSAYLSPVETTSVLPDASGNQRAGYCVELASADATCFPDLKTPYRVMPGSELQAVRSNDAQLVIGDQFTLMAFAERAYFSPFRYRFRQSIDDQTAAAIIDARLQFRQLDAGVELKVVEHYPESDPAAPWTIELSEVGELPSYSAISDLSLELFK